MPTHDFIVLLVNSHPFFVATHGDVVEVRPYEGFSMVGGWVLRVHKRMYAVRFEDGAVRSFQVLDDGAVAQVSLRKIA